MEMRNKSTLAPEAVFPSDYRIAARILQNRFLKAKKNYTRLENLNFQKVIRFMATESGAGEWRRLETERRALIAEFQRDPGSSGWFERDRAAQGRRKAFMIDRLIKSFMSMQFEHQGRRFRVDYPCFEESAIKEKITKTICRHCGADSDPKLNSDGAPSCRHCRTVDAFWYQTKILLELDPHIRKQDFYALWPTVRDFVSRYQSLKAPPGVATDTVQDWIHQSLAGKSVNDIATAELRKKRSGRWKKADAKNYRNNLKRAITESLRNHLGEKPVSSTFHA